MYRYGAEMLLQIARFQATRVGFSEKIGKYGFFGVMGPDEFHMMVNNNAYTNYMGMRALRCAADVLDAMRADAPEAYAALCEKVQLAPDEPAQWRHIADNMYIPEAPNHLFEQHDGFLSCRTRTPTAFRSASSRSTTTGRTTASTART